MKNLKEQKPEVENVQAVDVELNEEQLDVVSGGIIDGGCILLPDLTNFPDIIKPKAPDLQDVIFIGK